jgi:hypothetical protein
VTASQFSSVYAASASLHERGNRARSYIYLKTFTLVMDQDTISLRDHDSLLFTICTSDQ